MQRYGNKSGRSGVAAYRIAATCISVRFSDGAIYDYSFASAGRENVERMKVLARAGRGLCTFISQNVHDRYATKR